MIKESPWRCSLPLAPFRNCTMEVGIFAVCAREPIVRAITPDTISKELAAVMHRLVRTVDSYLPDLSAVAYYASSL